MIPQTEKTMLWQKLHPHSGTKNSNDQKLPSKKQTPEHNEPLLHDGVCMKVKKIALKRGGIRKGVMVLLRHLQRNAAIACFVQNPVESVFTSGRVRFSTACPAKHY